MPHYCAAGLQPSGRLPWHRGPRRQSPAWLSPSAGLPTFRSGWLRLGIGAKRIGFSCPIRHRPNEKSPTSARRWLGALPPKPNRKSSSGGSRARRARLLSVGRDSGLALMPNKHQWMRFDLIQLSPSARLLGMRNSHIGLDMARWVWQDTAVPAFLERYILPLLATTTVAIILNNPMGFDLTQRVTACIAILSAAYGVGHTLHKKRTSNPADGSGANSDLSAAKADAASMRDETLRLQVGPGSIVTHGQSGGQNTIIKTDIPPPSVTIEKRYMNEKDGEQFRSEFVLKLETRAPVPSLALVVRSPALKNLLVLQGGVLMVSYSRGPAIQSATIQNAAGEYVVRLWSASPESSFDVQYEIGGR